MKKKVALKKSKPTIPPSSTKNKSKKESNSTNVTEKAMLPISGQLLSAKSVYESLKKGKVTSSKNGKAAKSKKKKKTTLEKQPTAVVKKLSGANTSDLEPSCPKSENNNTMKVESEMIDMSDDDDSFQNSPVEDAYEIARGKEYQEEKLIPMEEESNSLEAVYSTLDTFDYILMNSNEALAFIPFKTCFYFKGRLGITVLSGVAEIQGYALHQDSNKTYQAFSPRGYSLQCVRSIEKGNKVLNTALTRNILKAAGLTCEESFLKEKSIGNVLLILRPLNENMIDYLSRLFPINILKKEDCVPRDWDQEERNKFSQLHNQLDASIVLRGSVFSARFYVQPDVWTEYTQHLIEKIQKGDPIRLMLLGGKGVGKSTLLRFIVNRLIQHCGSVLVIDFDPGQPEFFPAGCVSASLVSEPLLGPNFTHLRQPLYSYFVGDADIVGCPQRYVVSCRQLLDDCKLKLSLANIPTLINTMGFTSGIGLDVSLDLIRLAQPLQLLQITSRSIRRNFPAVLDREYVTQHPRGWLTNGSEWFERLPHYDLQGIYSSAELSEKSLEEWGFRPSELRQIGLMSYFSKMSTGPQWTLIDATPYRISWQNLAVCICHESVPPALTMAALNASLVALCTLNTEAAASVPYYQATAGQYPKILRELPLMPCLGYGVIRGIDTTNGYIYLISPEPAERLALVNCLVMGAVRLPENMLLDPPTTFERPKESGTCHKAHVPYTSFGPFVTQPACRPYRKYNPVFTLRNIV